MTVIARNCRAAMPAAVLAFCLGTFAHTPARKAPSASTGRDLYMQHCSSCHGTDGTGGGPAASALKVAPADLTRIAQKYNGFPKEKVMDWIDGEKYAVGHGSREMPVWGKRFRREGETGISGEVQALAAYLESIQKK